MRKRSFIVLVCLLAAFALAAGACGDDDEGGEGARGPTLIVYSSLPLQGASRPQTTAMVDGIRLAVKQRDGRAGGYQIKYVSLDDSTAQAGTWTPEATSANARKAAQDDNAIAYIYGAGLARNIENSAAELGLNVVTNEGIDPRAPNYRALAASLRHDGADCFVFSGITANGAVQLYKDVAAALPDAKLYGPDGVAESGFADPAEGGIPPSVAERVKVTVAAGARAVSAGGPQVLP